MKKYILIIIIITLGISLLSAADGFREETVKWLSDKGIAPEWIVIIISMVPIIELRGAIPVGMFLFGFTWWKAALLSIAGNMIPIPLVLLFMDAVVAAIRKVKMGVKFTDWLFERTRRRSKSLEKYKAAGLAVFVGIPLPGTGAWTGAFAANILGFRLWKSIWYIFLGVLMAAAAVTTLCQTGVIVLR